MRGQQLPKTIAVSSKALAQCVYGLDSEMFDDPEGRFLVHSAHAMDLHHWTVDAFRRSDGTLKRLRTVPWWLRKRWIETRCDPWQKLVIARRLAFGYAAAKSHPYIRVRTRRFALLARELFAIEASRDDESDEIGKELVSTEAYCEWVDRGGCPDLGRHLGVFWSMSS